ncbi:DUF3667 domain-containing protein [Novosphingobium sp. PASSN1]|uniref:DUF3667 domain-containing protein n=1 Tax=Novosphingobium sp. PASSN1 TaxID=2015561 RepID=UPI000BD52E72|nr:DUF3667 domain-containing protein [Novosphingobium sp. PASSN1]OYU36603.1 MAG: hypothetical protein CFE35_04845 [Novosphingobium sp. PASSN1]
MSESQVLGDAIGTGLTARAIEPNAGEGDSGHTHESACLNCNTPLVGSHCHNCGQAAHVHRTLAAFFHDLLHGVFHFEGKIWRTLPMLAVRPGRLTREYIDGRRASYVSPLALFLFSVFLLFAAIQSAAGETKIAEKDQIAIKVDAGKAAADARKELPALQAKRAQMVAAGADTNDMDMEIASREKVAAVMHGVASGEKIKSTGFTLLDDVVSEASANPNLALYKMQSHAYKYSWALIPISAPFLWMLFPFSRRFHLYDHTVFVTYSLSFMTLLTATITFAGTLGISGATALMGIVPPIHMYRQLRGAYGVSRLGGLLRTAALTLFAFIALLIFAMGIAAEAGGG